MVIAAMVNRSGLVVSRKCGGLDSAVASFAALAAMRRIVAADSLRNILARSPLFSLKRPRSPVRRIAGRREQAAARRHTAPESCPNGLVGLGLDSAGRA